VSTTSTATGVARLHDIRHTSEGDQAVPSSLGAVAGAAGFRSVELVRLVVTDRATVAEVRGVMHRYPRTVPVSLTTATRLVAAGASIQIDHAGTGRYR
jgi:hypothetical protein